MGGCFDLFFFPLVCVWNGVVRRGISGADQPLRQKRHWPPLLSLTAAAMMRVNRALNIYQVVWFEHLIVRCCGGFRGKAESAIGVRPRDNVRSEHQQAEGKKHCSIETLKLSGGGIGISNFALLTAGPLVSASSLSAFRRRTLTFLLAPWSLLHQAQYQKWIDSLYSHDA